MKVNDQTVVCLKITQTPLSFSTYITGQSKNI